ncbi:N-terminal kinase-like protein isoform X1 [Biomphalaria glabrata]|uniref:N-terminal kinase-like protein n=1 Tax=Biomphalaria glabrata TaxID=6526 RepID=A0A9U8E2K5_BIOGL|nr:N-terminal kinase-like protein isoform X1 [Biomphalaria glabrata]
MWSFFSRDPAKDFHYDIGEKVPGLEDKSIWTLHKGKKKANGESVSIFAFDVKSASDALVQTAKASLKRLKTLRHPNILTFLDGVETDKVIYFATEPVVPLETYLRENDSEGHNEIAISWGLHQIVKGLSFLVNDCNLIHNNVCMASIFVDPAGEWKLGGVDYMYPAQGPDSIPPVKILPLLERYNSPEKVEGKHLGAEKWSADMWGLGCLIWEVFNGTLPRTNALKAPGKIPQSLMANYCELVGANPKSRPNPAKFIENCRQKGGFMRNTFVDSMMFLEEIQIKDQTEKNKFFASLTPSLDTFPSLFCRNKILPQLLNAFEYGNAGSSILAPLFKIGKLLDADDYQKKIVPCVVKLFTSPDRATRVKLLQQIEFFAEHLQVNTVNDQIFPHVNSGFMDTNPMVRECTIKAMLHLAPKLNYKNLNEELMRQFARLQAKDDQGGIRTNTTVCLGKIACYINPAIRQKILCSAFMRAMKDPFPPARQAGILGIAATQNFYNLSEVANRLLPSLCSLTRDPDKGVRDQAFKTIKGFLSKLEKVSENPELEEDYEKEVMSGTATAASASGWAGWAVTGMSTLTSKIYSKSGVTKPTGDTSSPGSDKPSVQAVPSKPSSALPASEPSKPIQNQTAAPDVEDEEDTKEDGTGDGWEEDDWGDLDDTSKSIKIEDTEKDVNWDDDDNWDAIEDTKETKQPEDLKSKFAPKPSEFVSTKHTGLPTTDSYNWGGGSGTQDDFFSSMVTPAAQRSKSTTPVREVPPAKTTPPKETSQSKPSPAQQSSAAATVTKGKSSTPIKPDSAGWDDGAGSGWDDGDDWGGEKWGEIGESNSKETMADKMKREKEEKKKQRQKEIQEKREARKGGGAMKLGAKKVTDFDFS